MGKPAGVAIWWVLVVVFLLAQPVKATPSLHINLSRQVVYLIDNGWVLDASPISSGKPGYSTPRGKFRVVTKDIDHFSATYGQIVNYSGAVLVSDANSGMAVPRGAYFKKASMPYFMGFTAYHGLHAGYLPGYPASHGCVRMPAEKARRFFEIVPVGTPVYIF